MKRIHLTVLTLLVAAFYVLPLAANPRGVGSARFNVVEATITDIQKALQTRLVTSEQLVQMYLDRIAAYDTASIRRTDAEGREFYGLNSYIHINAHALEEARAIDAGRPRGNIKQPMYGVPILLKDNVNTGTCRRPQGRLRADRLDSAERCLHHAKVAGRGRDHPRQGDAHGVCQLPHQRHARRL